VGVTGGSTGGSVGVAGTGTDTSGIDTGTDTDEGTVKELGMETEVGNELTLVGMDIDGDMSTSMSPGTPPSPLESEESSSPLAALLVAPLADEESG